MSIIKITLAVTAAITASLILPFSAMASEMPLTIAEGLALATQQNRVVKIASYNRDMAEQDINAAMSRYFPSVNARADYTMLANQPGAVFGSSKVNTSNKQYPSYGVSINQTIFDFFGREAAYNATKVSLELTDTDISRTKNIVALDFINAYFTLLEHDKLIAVGQREVEALASHASIARAMFDAGTITKNDLLQAEVKLSDARQRLLQLEHQRSFYASIINRILSRPLNQPVTPSEVAEDAIVQPPLDKAWEMACSQRAELKMADNELRINEYRESAKRSEFFPTLFAEGGYSYTRNPYQVHDDNWAVLFGVKINIFSGGATKADLSKLRLRSEQIKETKNKLIDDIKIEVERYWLEEKTARENLAVTKEAVGQATENLRINRVRYEEGVGTATDVLDAISLLTMAEKNHYRALYDLRRSRAGLLYAIGEDLTKNYR